ncbi:N-6 DNA methylase [Thalassomonas viridans]|uniref:site-specific DNA-methyltransferase (adenine-specific) n=1 Tax=Thalassomonas viridans TaxID=137584 RepID=A0AAE9Z5C6_9GAMM|nr:N-6 DNA methylase [Thalassomonas viridans]WDE05432.1 N-6 DNA methylase [Thalassomonas viridans]
MSKKSGSYYTPTSLANFMVKYLFDNEYFSNKAISVLEPSCGDGVFLSALNELPLGSFDNVDAIDSDLVAVDKAKSLKLPELYKIYHADYLEWNLINHKCYDLIIGNPPYISKKLLSQKQKENCRKAHEKTPGFGSEVNNIWTSFLSDAIYRVNDKGIISFVLPAEILKVKFGVRIQKTLLNLFKRVEIFTFSSNVFPNIEQDTVILFLYKEHVSEGLYFTTINSSTCLINNRFILKRKRSLEKQKLKWSAYPLFEYQIAHVHKIKKSIPQITDYCETIPGIVTAANSYFIASQSTVDEYDLSSISQPIIQKGMYVNGCVKLSKSKMGRLINEGKPSFFLDFSKADLSNPRHKKYLKSGIEQRIPERYKCTLRENWYEVPGAWVAEGFFFKRCHDYPKLIFNEALALVTDASYRIKMKNGFDIKSLIFSFYNSMTLAFAELQGRYYGGGVLELTPSEFKSLPIPYIKITDELFDEFVARFHDKTSIEDILEFNDEIILKQELDMPHSEIASLKKVRDILLDRRLNISKSQFT